jgi:NAD(P)-dependent dehydrogenase (short-subunit alcohol dehydrogenase family)
MSIEKPESTRVAIVTGASRGLGAVVARVLRERGYDLVIGAHETQPLHAIADALRGHGGGRRRGGGRVVTVAGDIADAAVRLRLIDEAAALGGLHVVVNNASKLGGIAPLAEADPGRVSRVLQVNVVAPLDLIARALPLLTESRGLIVNISSDAAQGAYPGWGPYGASKAALDLLTRTLAAELRDRGVAAISVDPGDMRTRMHQEAFPGQDISDRPLPDVTTPFWDWLFDQDPLAISGTRFAAQQEHAPWLQQVS